MFPFRQKQTPSTQTPTACSKLLFLHCEVRLSSPNSNVTPCADKMRAIEPLDRCRPVVWVGVRTFLKMERSLDDLI
jgi:hypothetical protein